MPSTIPSEAAPALRAAVKNAGKTANTISEEKSLKRLVRPRKKMFRGKPKMRDSLLICEAEAIRQSVAKEHSPVFPSTALTCASGPRGSDCLLVGPSLARIRLVHFAANENEDDAATATRFRAAAGIGCSLRTPHILEARSAASGLQEQCGPQIGKSSPLRARRTRANPGEAARPDFARSLRRTWGDEPLHRARR